jgi:Zn2+/Cd2+-exporting ATPase
MRVHDHEVTEAHLDDRLVAAEAKALARSSRSFFDQYRPVFTSGDFVTALLTGGPALASWIVSLAGLEPMSSALGLAGAIVGGGRIAIGAVRGLVRREMNVDELVTIAIIASIVVGEYLGAALVAFMMLFGKVLEDVTAARAEAAIEGLGALVPETARIVDKDAPEGYRDVPVEIVQPGEVTIVRAGERIPVDGTIGAGRANVAEAAITGESVPVPKQAGDDCYAGTLVTGGALEIATTNVGEASALGRIAALVKHAEEDRAPIVRAADRWAKWFTPAVLSLAAVVGLVRQELLPA